jgi:uncharacterized protein
MFRQLTVFFAVSYLSSWLWWLPLYAPSFGLTVLPIFPFHHAIGGLGPLIASFTATALFEGTMGVRRLAENLVRPRSLLFLSIALFSPFLLAVCAGVIASIINQVPLHFGGLFTVREFPDFNIAVFFIYNLIFFGWGEETGWRGFALPRLQTRMNALAASLLLALFWALWHWPAFFYRPGYVGMGVGGILGWLFSLTTGSILLSWIFNSTRGSILCTAIFHSTIDIAFTSDFATGSIVSYIGFLITLWGILTILVWKPKNLARTERVIPYDVSVHTE